MSQSNDVPQVGPPDSDHRTSPIAEEGSEELENLYQEEDDEPCCYFNDQCFADGACVLSDNQLLRCDRGLWIPVDPPPY